MDEIIESSVPTKPILSPTDMVRIINMDNPTVPISSQTPLSQFDPFADAIIFG